MRRVLGAVGVTAVLALAAGVTALVLLPAGEGPPGPEPGRTLFRAQCATCHGADGRGGSWRARLLLLQPGDLTAPGVTAASDEYVAEIIRRGGSDFGKPGMPSFGFTLTEAEIQALVAYLRALPAATRGAPG